MSAAAATVSASWRVATTPGKSVLWKTPPALFLPLDREFGFSIDVAADADSALCDRHFDSEADALAQSWARERVFCNPPYGRRLGDWVGKAMIEAQEHGALVTMVLPARTGVKWFHRYCLPHAEVRFIQGRLRFIHAITGDSERAPFDSMVVVFHPYRIGEGHTKSQPTFPGFPR